MLSDNISDTDGQIQCSPHDKVDVLVLGGGYSGLWSAVNAVDLADECGKTLSVTLVSRDDFLVHRPRLYERQPEALRVPLRPLLEPVGVNFIQGEAQRVDSGNHTVAIQTGLGVRSLHYSRLVLATGSELRSLPVPGLAEHAFNVDSYHGALAFDEHLKGLASDFGTEEARTFVIVGAGMTGIELAAELRDRISEHAGPNEAENARIILVENADRVGPSFGDSPRPLIEEALRQARVELRLGNTLKGLDANSATLGNGEVLATRTVVMTVGMRASALTGEIPAVRDELGRLHVDMHLRVRGVPDIFATGDVAYAFVDEDHVAVMSCQNSRTMGKYAGRNAAADLLGGDITPYRQADYTTCLDLGRFGAVYTEGFDREVKSYGAKAKERKKFINTQLIYPPEPGSREQILAAMRIDDRGR